MGSTALHIDVLIFGGGAAGLWLLDELHRRGYAVLLIERHTLGAGQTIACQGIIHGGVKYTLSGSMTASARAIREMPGLWRDCCQGRRQPDLRGTRILSNTCLLWRTDSWSSRLGLVGARVGLRSGVTKIGAAERPAVLSRCSGAVFCVDEPVIDVASFLTTLATRHRNRLLRVAADEEIGFSHSKRGSAEEVNLRADGRELTLRPGAVVLTAGAGNAELREAIGLAPNAMQRRPLHMVLLRGNLPALFGHCVDGARTRVTVTSATDSDGRTVWNVGGQIAQDGVSMDAPQVIERARQELSEVLPGIALDKVEWTAHRIDRAEARTPGGERPAGPTVLVDRNVLTVWPTKLALVPQVIGMVIERLHRPDKDYAQRQALSVDWARPAVAFPPWEISDQWRN